MIKCHSVCSKLDGAFDGEFLMTALKKFLAGPMSGKMRDSSSGAHDARTNLKQADANGIRIGVGQCRIGQDPSSEVGQ